MDMTTIELQDEKDRKWMKDNNIKQLSDEELEMEFQQSGIDQEPIIDEETASDLKWMKDNNIKQLSDEELENEFERIEFEHEAKTRTVDDWKGLNPDVEELDHSYAGVFLGLDTEPSKVDTMIATQSALFNETEDYNYDDVDVSTERLRVFFEGKFGRKLNDIELMEYVKEDSGKTDPSAALEYYRKLNSSAELDITETYDIDQPQINDPLWKHWKWGGLNAIDNSSEGFFMSLHNTLKMDVERRSSHIEFGYGSDTPFNRFIVDIENGLANAIDFEELYLGVEFNEGRIGGGEYETFAGEAPVGNDFKHQVAQGIGQATVAIPLSMVNPILGFSNNYNLMYREGLEQTGNHEKAVTYGIIGGLIDTVGDRLLAKPLGVLAKTKFITRVLSKMGFSFASEGSGESLQYVLLQKLDGESVEFSELMNNFVVGGTVGMLLGGAEPVISGIGESLPKKYNHKLGQAVTKRDVDAIISSLENEEHTSYEDDQGMEHTIDTGNEEGIIIGVDENGVVTISGENNLTKSTSEDGHTIYENEHYKLTIDEKNGVVLVENGDTSYIVDQKGITDGNLDYGQIFYDQDGLDLYNSKKDLLIESRRLSKELESITTKEEFKLFIESGKMGELADMIDTITENSPHQITPMGNDILSPKSASEWKTIKQVYTEEQIEQNLVGVDDETASMVMDAINGDVIAQDNLNKMYQLSQISVKINEGVDLTQDELKLLRANYKKDLDTNIPDDTDLRDIYKKINSNMANNSIFRNYTQWWSQMSYLKLYPKVASRIRLYESDVNNWFHTQHKKVAGTLTSMKTIERIIDVISSIDTPYTGRKGEYQGKIRRNNREIKRLNNTIRDILIERGLISKNLNEKIEGYDYTALDLVNAFVYSMDEAGYNEDVVGRKEGELKVDDSSSADNIEISLDEDEVMNITHEVLVEFHETWDGNIDNTPDYINSEGRIGAEYLASLFLKGGKSEIGSIDKDTLTLIRELSDQHRNLRTNRQTVATEESSRTGGVSQGEIIKQLHDKAQVQLFAGDIKGAFESYNKLKDILKSIEISVGVTSFEFTDDIPADVANLFDVARQKVTDSARSKDDNGSVNDEDIKALKKLNAKYSKYLIPKPSKSQTSQLNRLRSSINNITSDTTFISSLQDILNQSHGILNGNFIKDYYPRKVKDIDELRKYIREHPEMVKGDPSESAIKEALLGIGNNHRKVLDVNTDMLQYYESPIDALEGYILTVARKRAKNKLIGVNGESKIDDNTGEVIDEIPEYQDLVKIIESDIIENDTKKIEIDRLVEQIQTIMTTKKTTDFQRLYKRIASVGYVSGPKTVMRQYLDTVIVVGDMMGIEQEAGHNKLKQFNRRWRTDKKILTDWSIPASYDENGNVIEAEISIDFDEFLEYLGAELTDMDLDKADIPSYYNIQQHLKELKRIRKDHNLNKSYPKSLYKILKEMGKIEGVNKKDLKNLRKSFAKDEVGKNIEPKLETAQAILMTALRMSDKSNRLNALKHRVSQLSDLVNGNKKEQAAARNVILKVLGGDTHLTDLAIDGIKNKELNDASRMALYAILADKHPLNPSETGNAREKLGELGVYTTTFKSFAMKQVGRWNDMVLNPVIRTRYAFNMASDLKIEILTIEKSMESNLLTDVERDGLNKEMNTKKVQLEYTRALYQRSLKAAMEGLKLFLLFTTIPSALLDYGLIELWSKMGLSDRKKDNTVMGNVVEKLTDNPFINSYNVEKALRTGDITALLDGLFSFPLPHALENIWSGISDVSRGDDIDYNEWLENTSGVSEMATIPFRVDN